MIVKDRNRILEMKKSKKINKKYDVYFNGKYLVSFGDSRYQHYKDKIGLWSALDHNDKARRKNYLARAKGIKDKKGKLTKDNINSANYFSINYLW